MKIKNAAALRSLENGFSWESTQTFQAGFFQILLFALATGDWNKIHINPFTLFLFKSKLGGMTCPGDMVLSLTKKAIYQIFEFEKETEVIAFNYREVEFSRPLRVWTLYRYGYTFLGTIVEDNKTKYKWKIEVINQKTSEVLCSAIWLCGFYSATKSKVGKVLLPVFGFVKSFTTILFYIFACVVLFSGPLLLVSSLIFNKSIPITESFGL